MSGHHKWNFDTGGSHVVGSPTSGRPIRDTQASLTGWGEETAKWRRHFTVHGCLLGDGLGERLTQLRDRRSRSYGAE